jgi:hypothetical protein
MSVNAILKIMYMFSKWFLRHTLPKYSFVNIILYNIRTACASNLYHMYTRASLLCRTYFVCLTSAPYLLRVPHFFAVPTSCASHLRRTYFVYLTSLPYLLRVPHFFAVPTSCASHLSRSYFVCLTSVPYLLRVPHICDYLLRVPHICAVPTSCASHLCRTYCMCLICIVHTTCASHLVFLRLTAVVTRGRMNLTKLLFVGLSLQYF